MSLLNPLNLPNPRRLFRPDPGMILVEPDLAGADARVMAWECGGQLKEDFRNGVKIHVKTMEWLSSTFMGQLRLHPNWPKVEPWYTRTKNVFFGTSYGGGPPTISTESGMPLHIVKAAQPWIFQRYPEIKSWHRRNEGKRSASNAFGYRIIFFDRIEGLLPEILAWIPQSTVAIACMRGGLQIKEKISWAQPLLQNHDAILYQIPKTRYNDLPLLRKAFEVVVPYSDPLLMKATFKASDKSWGDCVEVDMDSRM
jgi:hypothetical protein